MTMVCISHATGQFAFSPSPYDVIHIYVLIRECFSLPLFIRPIVECLKEMKGVPIEIWRELYDEIISTVRVLHPKILVENADRDIDEESTKALASDNRIPSEILYALFSICEQLEMYKLAWRFLSVGHYIEKSRRPVHNAVVSQENTERILNIFQPQFWPAGVGSSSKVPVFIIGFMRSGSTLLEQMLDAHTEIFGIGEDSIFNGQLNNIRNNVVAAVQISQDKVRQAVDEDSKIVLKKMLLKANQSSDDTKKRQRVKRVVDKMLFNYRNVGFIHLLFPNAIILHTVRDPMDVLFSCYKNKFDDRGLEWSLDTEHLVEEYILYLRLMSHWRKVLPGRVIDIQYENVVYKTEESIKNIIENNLKLKWEPEVLEFHSTQRSVLSNSMSQVRHDISDKSIGGWRRYKDELQKTINLLQPQLKRLAEVDGLPFPVSVNWRLATDFDYCSVLNCTSFR